jgi:hypothetical protein
LGEALALEQQVHRTWAQRAELHGVQARTGAVMAANRTRLAAHTPGSEPA